MMMHIKLDSVRKFITYYSIEILYNYPGIFCIVIPEGFYRESSHNLLFSGFPIKTCGNDKWRGTYNFSILMAITIILITTCEFPDRN